MEAISVEVGGMTQTALRALVGLAVLLLLSIGAGADSAWGQTELPYSEETLIGCGPAPDDATLVAAGARIGQIRVRVNDVFDLGNPKENKRVFRLVNRIHIDTKPQVVRNLLLFRTGDRFDRRLLEETERFLRAEGIFSDAKVTAEQLCGDAVDLIVDVKDVWTLFLSAGFSRSGGTNNTRFELEDANFLGSGKDVAIEQRSNVDRDSTLGRYRDHNFLGSRTRLELWYADNSDGSFQVFDVRQPFYALETRFSAGLRVRLEEKVDKLYRLGSIFSSFRHDQDFIEAFVGRSTGLKNGRVVRWLAGGTYLADRFLKAPKEVEPIFIPPDRVLSYPWIGFEYIRDDFREASNLDQITRTEDLSLGLRANGRVGFSAEALGGDADRLIFQLNASQGFELGDRGLLLTSAYSSGRWGDDGAENWVTGALGKLYFRDFGKHQFAVSLGGDVAENLDFDNQILLGGDNGLRGYPLRYQQGDRRVLLTLEQRFYTDWQIFRVVQVGGAMFFDIGRAWFAGEQLFPPARPVLAQGWLKDVGVGLRLSSIRSGRGTMAHLDIAFPLDGDPSIDKVQWLVRTRESF